MTDSFSNRIMNQTPGGDRLALCLQCGTCGGSCPSAADMDATPRTLFAMIMAEMEDEVLSSSTPWYCVSCYYCMTRCPQNIPITDLMYTLKQDAISHGYYQENDHADWSTSFIGYVERYGRSFEFGLATRYHLSHHPLKAFQKRGLAFKMMRKGRLSRSPTKIRNMPQLTSILNEAKRIAAEQEV